MKTRRAVKNKYCTFFFEDKYVFVSINDDDLNPTFMLETNLPNKKSPPLRLKDHEWLDIIDIAYRHKITDSDKFYRLVYNTYKLTAVNRRENV